LASLIGVLLNDINAEPFDRRSDPEPEPGLLVLIMTPWPDGKVLSRHQLLRARSAPVNVALVSVINGT
jgi:hypothetical protein